MSDEANTATEEWRAIPGFEGIYSASSLGRIRREPWAKSPTGNPVNPYGKNGGYVRVNLWKNGKVKTVDVHRLVLLAFRGFDCSKPVGNHIDRNKRNNRIDNLEWCTTSQNIRHSIRAIYGAYPKPKPPKKPKQYKKGEDHYAHKIKDADVIQIIRLYAAGGTSQQAIADMFGVNQTHISSIVARRKWKHVA